MNLDPFLFTIAGIMALGLLWRIYRDRQEAAEDRGYNVGYTQGSEDTARAAWERDDRRQTIERQRRLASCTCGREAARQQASEPGT